MLFRSDRTIVDVAEWIFNRPVYEYEPEPEPRRDRRRGSRGEEPSRSSGRSAIDIPVDDGPLADQEPPPRGKKGFFDRSPRVPAPDQVLRPREEARSAFPEEPQYYEEESLSISKPEPITRPAPPRRPVEEPAAPPPAAPPAPPVTPPVSPRGARAL